MILDESKFSRLTFSASYKRQSQKTVNIFTIWSQTPSCFHPFTVCLTFPRGEQQNPEFQNCFESFVCLCEPLSLLGALISPDVLCSSVATSNLRSGYLQFIACPVSVGLTLKISPPRFQFKLRVETLHVKMINEREMEYFPAASRFPSSKSGGVGREMGEGAVFKMQSQRKMKKTKYTGTS